MAKKKITILCPIEVEIDEKQKLLSFKNPDKIQIEKALDLWSEVGDPCDPHYRQILRCCKI